MPIITSREAMNNALLVTGILPLSPGVDPEPIRDRHAANVVTRALVALRVDEKKARTLAYNLGGVPRVRFDKALTKLGIST